MSNYAVITENDESAWEDQTGLRYHFPKRYAELLRPSTQVVYYKGTQRLTAFSGQRLSAAPHYFGVAVIGNVWPDDSSRKGDLFAEVLDYRPFAQAVLAKVDGEFVEPIPLGRQANHWRFGVRAIDAATYTRIRALAGLPTGVEVHDGTTPRANDIQSPARTVATTVYRILRETEMVRRLKRLYGNRCQLCGEAVRLGVDELYSEGHHIRPLGAPHFGPDIPGNILILCPNHHVQCDYGAVSLDLARLRRDPSHPIEAAFVDYHNAMRWGGAKPTDGAAHG